MWKVAAPTFPSHSVSSKATNLGDLHAAVALAPAIEGVLRDAMGVADGGDGRFGRLRLAQDREGQRTTVGQAQQAQHSKAAYGLVGVAGDCKALTSVGSGHIITRP